MEIVIQGFIGKQEILELVAKTLNTLESLGVNQFNNVAVEFSAFVNDTKVEPKLQNNLSAISLLSTYKHIKRSCINECEKITYDCNVDPATFNLTDVLPLDCEISLPKLEVIERGDQNLCKAGNQKLKVKRGDRFNMLQFKKECFKKVASCYGVSVAQITNEKSSNGWICSAQGIKRYLSDCDSDRLYRITINEDNVERKRVHLFTIDGELIYRGVLSR